MTGTKASTSYAQGSRADNLIPLGCGRAIIGTVVESTHSSKKQSHQELRADGIIGGRLQGQPHNIRDNSQ